MTLQVLWFLLVGFLLTVYAVLDGFDLGVGFWSFFTKNDGEKRVLLNAIGPFWDGNEVWLLTGAGALFAAFPPVYATVFSGFYLALMLVLFSLIVRAVAVEFRSKVNSPGWRGKWDFAFALSSSLPALLFGVALGNVMRGVPLTAEGEFAGDFFTLLNPYALLIGLTGFFMILTHGAVYIVLKTDGELAERAKGWSVFSSRALLVLILACSAWTLAAFPRLTENFKAFPLWFAAPAAAIIAAVLVCRSVKADKPGRAFIASSILIAALMGTAGITIYPYLLPALDGGGLSIFNASSSKLTLTVMAILAVIGMPFVVGYTIWIYKTFGGKVGKGEGAY